MTRIYVPSQLPPDDLDLLIMEGLKDPAFAEVYWQTQDYIMGRRAGFPDRLVSIAERLGVSSRT